MRFEIKFSGHKNIRSNHTKTIEITKDSKLTPQGDCIIGVNASSSCLDLPLSLKKKLQDPKSKIIFEIRVKHLKFVVKGRGHQDLILTHPRDIVIRKSSFVCPRTLAVNCDKASDLLPRKIVNLLKDPKSQGTFTIIIE